MAGNATGTDGSMDHRAMRSAAAACLIAVALAWTAGATASDRVTVAALLAAPAAYDDRDVAVAGVVGQQQWVNLTVLGNPPYQAWFPAFLLVDDSVGLWVVVRTGPSGPATRSALAVPPAGARVEVHGRFWAVSKSIEMDRPFVLLR
jgi:hypothetical protein